MTEKNSASSRSAASTVPDLEKLADLCAVGAYPIPNDLPGDRLRKLLVAIAARRRKRLIHLFASAIAEDIWREQQARGKTDVE